MEVMALGLEKKALTLGFRTTLSAGASSGYRLKEGEERQHLEMHPATHTHYLLQFLQQPCEVDAIIIPILTETEAPRVLHNSLKFLFATKLQN